MADPVTDPQTQEPAAPVEAPVPWTTVAADPAFRKAAPEDKLVAFGRWHDQAYDFATQQPDWEQHKDNFNQSAAEIQSDLGKAAGGLSLDQARAKVGQQAVDAARAEHAAANPPRRGVDLFDTAQPPMENPLGGLAGTAPTSLGETTRTEEPAPFTDAQERAALRPYGPDIWKAYYDQKAPQPTSENQGDTSTTGQFGHEMLDIGREFQANLATKLAYGETALKNTWSKISDQLLGTNIAVPDKAPDTQAALADYDRRIMNAHETYLRMPSDNPDYDRVKNEYQGLVAARKDFAASQNRTEENFTNAVEDLSNTLGSIDPTFHVDPSLKNTLNTKLSGLAGDIGPAFLPGIGLPMMLTESAVTKWGQTYQSTNGDQQAADSALAQDLGTNLLFMGLAHGSNNLLLNAISTKVKIPGEDAFINLPTVSAGKSLAIRTAGGAAANAIIGQAIQGAEEAKNAPEGEKLAAFAKAFNTPDGANLAQAIGFGILGARPIESIRAVAMERARSRPQPAAQPQAEAQAADLEQSGAPKTAQVVREEAAANPELAAGEGLYTPPAPPATPPDIRLVSRAAKDGTYTHNLQIGPNTSVEQLQEFKKNVDLNHLPPVERTAVTEQIDNAIAGKQGGTVTAPTAAAEATGHIVGPILVNPEGKELVRGNIGDTHAIIMNRRVAELEKAGATKEQINEVLDAGLNDEQHKFIDDQNNQHDRATGAQVAVEAGQAPAGTTSLQSQNLRPPGFHPAAIRAAVAPAEGGQTEEITTGWTDKPLDDRGKETADRLGKAVGNSVAELHTSPLARTQETAKAVTDAGGPPAQVDTGLGPIQLGSLEGKPRALADRAIQRMIENPDAPAAKGAESLNQFLGRAINSVKSLVEKIRGNPDEKIAAITHSKNIDAVLGWLAKGAPADNSIDTAALTDPDKFAGPIQPGEAIRVNVGADGKLTATRAQPGDKAPGLYLIRHGETEWDNMGEAGVVKGPFTIQRQHPLTTPSERQPTQREVATSNLTPKTPEEKAARIAKGRQESMDSALESGLQPLHTELHSATANKTEASKLEKEIAARLAKEFPPETLAKGEKETADTNKLTGDKLPTVVGADGKVRPKFTNNPEITAQQLDLGQRVVVPKELLGPDDYKVNPAITLGLDKATGEKYVMATDVKLPDGRVETITGPDEFTKAYKEAIQFEKQQGAQAQIRLDPETLQKVKDQVDRELGEKGINYQPLEFDQEFEPGNVDENPDAVVRGKIDQVEAPTAATLAPEHLAVVSMKNYTDLDRVGLADPTKVDNPLRTALGKISADTSMSVGDRKLAKALLRSSIDWGKVAFQLYADPTNTEKGIGFYSSFAEDLTKGMIQLNTASPHEGSIITSLLHEAVHHATMRKLAADYKRNPYEEVAYQSLKRSYVKALKLAFHSVMGRNAITEGELREFATAQGLGPVSKKYGRQRKFYGLSNLGEFISEALSNKSLQIFLAGSPDTRGELTGRVRKFVDQIKESLKRLVVGQHFEKGGLLDQTLDASFALLRHPPEQARTGRALSVGRVDLGLPTGKPEDLAKMTRIDLVKLYREQRGEENNDVLQTMSTQEIRDALSPTKAEPKFQGTPEIPPEAYGWLGPDGKFYKADFGGHEETAREIIQNNPKVSADFDKETEKNPDLLVRDVAGNHGPITNFMTEHGFVRVVGGPGNTTTYIQGNPTRSQLQKLKDHAIEKGAPLIHDLVTRAKEIVPARSMATAPAEEAEPQLTHETNAAGQTVHGLEIPPGTSAENLRGALDMIASSKIPIEEKNRLIAQVGEKLATFQVDSAADKYTKLQEQIAKQPNGEPTAAQSAELDKIKADMPSVVDHPQVQASAQALRLIPGYLDVNDTLARHFNATLNWLNTTDNANWWGAWYNAAENKAKIFSKQRANDIRGVLRRAMNRSNKAPTLTGILADIVKSAGRLVGHGPAEWATKERDERALSMVVEAKNDPAALDVMRAKIRAALANPNNRGPFWTRAANQAIDAIDHAKANWARLSIAADQYAKYNSDQVRLENSRGVATNFRQGYVPHIQDMESDPDTAVLFNGSSGTGGVGFKKMRTYDTFADSIAAGVTPKTLNAIDAMENRINRGMTTIGRQEWAQAGRQLTDPVTNTPLVADVIIDKHPKTGDTQTRAPDGYVLKLLGNRQIAVHKQYGGLFDAFTKPSAIRENIYGNAALQAEGLVKHGLLLFDTFHLGRLAYYQGALRGKSTFTKGMLALDYSDGELQRMEQNGDLPPNIKAQDLIARKQQMQGLIDQGLNVGGIQETINAGLARKIPVVGDFNKFVFEQFQRGGMVESALSELDRQRSAFPELDEQSLQRKVARDINTRFGNLKKEGWLYSDTMSDLANLVLLAPSWNEGLIRSELGLGKQALQSAKDLTLGYKDASGDRVRTLRAGTLLKGGGTLFLGTLVMNQIINYISRGHPTWENPEEGLNSKISAWIPDKIGKGPGFFLNPFTLPAEITHQILEQTDHGLNWQQAIAKVAGYKFSPVLRAAETFRSQTDRFGRPLYSKWDVMKEMVNDVTPMPIFGQAGYAAVKSLSQGKVAEPYKGAIQKQAFATAGIKLSGAPSDATRLNRLANDYLKSVGKAKDTRYTGSDYQNLRQAIENNDPERAQKEYQKLLETKKPRDIDKHFRDQVHSALTGKRELEARFRDTLSPEQQDAYDRMIKQREDLRDAYFDLNLHPEESNAE